MKTISLTIAASLILAGVASAQTPSREQIAQNIVAMMSDTNVFGYACNVSDADRRSVEIAVVGYAEQFDIDINWVRQKVHERDSKWSAFDIHSEEFRKFVHSKDGCLRMIDPAIRVANDARRILGH